MLRVQPLRAALFQRCFKPVYVMLGTLPYYYYYSSFEVYAVKDYDTYLASQDLLAKDSQ